MAKTYRPYCPDQMFLLPPSVRDWLPENHLSYFVSDVVDSLDLEAIESYYEKEERGYPPYHPKMMTKVLVYAYCVGVFSSRKIQNRLVEDVAFRVLAADNRPDFRTISDFRKIHHEALEGLFQQVLRLALEARRAGRQQGESERLQAQGDELRAHEGGRARAARRSP
jgi:transposase